MSGSYLVKAVTLQGVYSTTAAKITSDIPGLVSLNSVAVFTEDPTFAGTKDGVEVVSSKLRLGSSSPMSTWTTLASVPFLYSGTLSLTTGGYYYFASSLDLGAIYTARVTTVIEAHGETVGNFMSTWPTLSVVQLLDDADPSEWNVTLEYRKTTVDPSLNTWTAWEPVIVGDILSWGMQFRLHMESTSGLAVVPVVEGLEVKVDMDDRIEAGRDVVSNAAGTTITFSPAFRQLDGLAISTHAWGNNESYSVTAKTRTGFTIQYFSASGTGISRTFDWVAKGYGRQT